MKNKGKSLQGIVVSDSMDKSIVVQVDSQKRDRRFKKTQKIHKKIMVHDDQNQAKVGNKVSIQEGRPWSKKKTFYLFNIVDPLK